MVSLVKARKKAKEKKEQEQLERDAGEATQAVGDAAAASPEPAPVAPVPAATAPGKAAEAADTEAGPAPGTQHSAAVPVAVAAHEKLEAFKRTANQLRDDSLDADRLAVVAETTVLELLLFSIAGEQYALPIERIIEIIQPRSATRVPNADSAVLGIISLRGTIVSILDIRRKLGHPPISSTGPDSRIIVLENDGETAGFLVDRVLRVARVEPSHVENHPVVTVSEQSEFIRGVFQHSQRLSILLDLERLLKF